MSRLSSHRANAPIHGVTKPSRFKGFRKHSKNWREGEPLLVLQPCRSALNEAIRNEDKEAADHISAKRHRHIYSSISKPALLYLTLGILHGERLYAGS